MLQGVDPGPRGSVKEYLLVKLQNRKEQLADMRFIITMKSNTLDRSNADEVEKFNELLREYQSLLDPKALIASKNSYKEKAELLKSFNADFKNKVKSGKFKNFQKVKPIWPTKPLTTK